ncbi:hypothetical protein E4G67_00995 [Candidatus Bathyarchaeota archaeon]|nr:MAG: hypothetical protein E4G67_00995 [Candidatus Bathyarchaeota archaeon]
MPKDVNKILYDENCSPAVIKSYHFENEENQPGFYYFEGEVYLPKTYLKKELKLSNKELEKIITNDKVQTESVTNEYRTFRVYNLKDVQEVLKVLRVFSTMLKKEK